MQIFIKCKGKKDKIYEKSAFPYTQEYSCRFTVPSWLASLTCHYIRFSSYNRVTP